MRGHGGFGAIGQLVMFEGGSCDGVDYLRQDSDSVVRASNIWISSSPRNASSAARDIEKVRASLYFDLLVIATLTHLTITPLISQCTTTVVGIHRPSPSCGAWLISESSPGIQSPSRLWRSAAWHGAWNGARHGTPRNGCVFLADMTTV